MIEREDILSVEFLKKTEYHGCHRGMRYRMEKVQDGEQDKLKATVWPEPFSFWKTPEEEKTGELFSFDEDGIQDAIRWMNERLTKERDRFEAAPGMWHKYKM